MPLVHIDLIEGRSQDQLRAMVKDVTEAIVKTQGHPLNTFMSCSTKWPKNITLSAVF